MTNAIEIIQKRNMGDDFEINTEQKIIGVKRHKKNTEKIDELPLTLSDAENIHELATLAKDSNRPIVDYNIKTIEIDQDLSFRHCSVNLPNITFILKNNAKIILGGSSNKVENPTQVLYKVVRDVFVMRELDPTLIPYATIEILGAKNQSITVKQTEFIHFKLQDDVDSRSQAYSKFDLNFVQRIKIGESTDSNKLWFNENVFYLNRVYGFEMYGGYHHNNNIMHGGSFDYRNSFIKLESGIYNTFESLRVEEIDSIYLGPNTNNNVLKINWNSSIQKSFMLGTKRGHYEDHGRLNRLIYPIERYSVKTRVAVKVGGLEKATASWAKIWSSNFFDIKAFEDLIVFDWDNPAAKYLIVMECFDADGNKIVPSDHESPFLQVRTQDTRLQGHYPGGQRYGTRYVIIKDPNVKYCRASIHTNNEPNGVEKSTKFSVDVYSNEPRGTWV